LYLAHWAKGKLEKNQKHNRRGPSAMADKNVPLSWYAILIAGEPYFDMFELMKDPRLEPVDINGQRFGKLTYSAFDDYEDYERVLHETQELVALLTGTLRISQGSGPPRISLDFVNMISVRNPASTPHPTTEQYIMEYVIRSGNQRVKDVLHYLSNPPDFFNLYKILEVITKDLGKGSKGSKHKAYSLIEKRGWATKTDLDAFDYTANNVHRHWKENRTAPRMNLQEAVIMSRRIIRGWVADLAGLVPPRQAPG
jgi:hypothetical protein